jgi:hypothetical protein
MLKFGEEPFLECSSKGDKRFSAFYARLKRKDKKSIEELYQSGKLFEDGSTNLSWKEAKGRQPINMHFCRLHYKRLWDWYFEENPELKEVIKQYNGFTDIFGQEGHCCQAEEIYRIRYAKD